MWHDTLRLRRPVQALHILWGHRNGVLLRFYIVNKVLWRINHDSFMYHDSCATRPILTWHDSVVCDVTPLYETRLLCMWQDSFVLDKSDSFIYVTWRHILFCDATSIASHIHMWRDIHTWDTLHLSADMTLCSRSSTLRSSRQNFRDMTHLHCHASCDTTHTYVTWLIYTWYDSFVRETRLTSSLTQCCALAL